MTAEYLKEQGFEVLTSKAAAIAFTRRYMDMYFLTINERKVPFVRIHSFLGVTIYRRITWTPHINRFKMLVLAYWRTGVRSVNSFCQWYNLGGHCTIFCTLISSTVLCATVSPCLTAHARHIWHIKQGLYTLVLPCHVLHLLRDSALSPVNYPFMHFKCKKLCGFNSDIQLNTKTTKSPRY